MEVADIIDKQKNNIVNIVVIILALIIANKIYKQQVKEIKALKERTAVEMKKNGVLENIAKSAKRINVYKSLFVTTDASQAMNNISNMARESGIKISSIKPSGQRDFPVYSKFPFSLQISAPNYHALGKFISKLESHRDIFSVESIDIKFGGQNKELTASLILSNIIIKN